MEFINQLIDIVLHIDKYLDIVIKHCGAWSYGVLGLIIFSETGFVVTPFLPGDSLLFAAGVFAATGSFQLAWLFIVLAAAAIAGDSANYTIGKFVGEKIFKENARILKKKYLDRTHEFYAKHGRKTIILARFVPIIRTFAPFVAGAGKMDYLKFFASNVIGGLLWVTILVSAGFYFGNVPFVRDNFPLVILAIILISIMPIVIEYLRHRSRKP